jgi:hydrogenase maturation factor
MTEQQWLEFCVHYGFVMASLYKHKELEALKKLNEVFELNKALYEKSKRK